MTKDDVIQMAREAGSIDSEEVITTVWAAFTAAEREACIDWIKAFSIVGDRSEEMIAAIRARSET